MTSPGDTAVGERYPTVDEVAAAARALALRRPEVCRLRTVGLSRAGEPLLLLSVGHGSRNVLVVAGPHANEMVGGATALLLARRIAADPVLRDAADAAWHFLLCADPDGARLNEAVPEGRFTMLGHYRHFFRPRAAEQPEWLPDDGTLDGALPETRALIGVIDELRPVLQCSLHGVDVGGTFVQVTRDIPRLAERIAKSAAELDIPLEAGASDAFHWPSPGPGVYVLPPPGGPREDASHSTWTYAHRYGGTTAIAEVPMWACDRAADTSPHPGADAALRAAGERLRRASLLVGGLIGEVRPYLPGDDGPLLRAAREIVAVAPALAADWDPALRTAAAPPLPAMTRARVGSVEIYAQRLPLRAAAMLLRAVRGVQAPPVRLAGPRDVLERLVADWCEAYETAHRARWIPVRHQVEQHAGAVLAAFDLLPG
ncbi:M14 family zinc carboxypeptidase [Actinacidiphila sp. bgisy167]|uniref:M14 family zinc carboxypeptidase n=1 Tax=Actinacidiphila sp. bgisy167 TaxID=3413797 RepID=UPI003D73D413